MRLFKPNADEVCETGIAESPKHSIAQERNQPVAVRGQGV